MEARREREAATPKQTNPLPGNAIAAVFDIEDVGRTFSRGAIAQVTEYLAASLSQRFGCGVVPRDQLRSQVRESKAASYEACVDQACQIELGKAVAANKSVATKVLRIGKTCIMTTQIFDLRTEIAERSATADTECSEEGMLGGVRALIEALAK